MVKATEPKPTRKPERYAETTINSWLRVLRTMYSDACRLRGLTFNPATAVKPLVEPHDLEDTNSLPPEQLAEVLIELRKGNPVLAMAAWTQAWTGMRWGELSALKWSDLDEERRILLVRRTVQKGKLVPSTKTKRARRAGVPEPLLEALRAYRAELVADEHPGLDSGLMFPSTVGKPLWSSRISEALRAALKGAGITQRFTSQGFRRSMTDLLREAAVDPVVAKAITGHTTDRMREHYSTVRLEDVRAAGDAAAALMTPKLRLIQGGADAEESSEESSPPDGMTTAG
ncbi:MAG TPA: site-specific integrase [Sandaracinaceae bacterium LLY-WYZ-13_1]|nr:site-specific integrase [Sandaracinaceae bacterium LLY-WYZ-13_1]